MLQLELFQKLFKREENAANESLRAKTKWSGPVRCADDSQLIGKTLLLACAE